MVFQFIKKVIMYVPNKVIGINHNVNRIINLTTSIDKTFTYVTKVTGATTGTTDNLQICTSFIPSPNVITVVTMSISVDCKVLFGVVKNQSYVRVVVSLKVDLVDIQFNFEEMKKSCIKESDFISIIGFE